jgi:hypothetical protein
LQKTKGSEKAQENKTPQSGNSRDAYMREYSKRMRLEKDICNNVPKRTKLNAERQYDYRKLKAQEKAQENKTPQASKSTDPTPAQIIYNYNQASEYFQKNFWQGEVVRICQSYWRVTLTSTWKIITIPNL